MELAIVFGMPDEELARRLTSKAFTRWKAYARLRPFGNEAADLRAGIVASVISGKRPIDHMQVVRELNNIPKIHRASPEELREKAKQIAASLGAAGKPKTRK